VAADKVVSVAEEEKTVNGEQRPSGGEALVGWRLDQLEKALLRHLNECEKYRERQDTKMNYALGMLFTLVIEALLILGKTYIGG